VGEQHTLKIAVGETQLPGVHPYFDPWLGSLDKKKKKKKKQKKKNLFFAKSNGN